MTVAAPAAPGPGAAAAAPPATPAPGGLEAAVQLLQAGAGPKPPAPAAPAGGAAAKSPDAEPAKPKEELPDFGSRGLAAAMRKERALLDRERAVKTLEGQLKTTQAQIEQAQRELDARMKQLGETDAQRRARRAEYVRPGGYKLALQDLGLTYEQLTEAVMAGDEGTLPPSVLLERVEERLAQANRSVDERLEKLQKAEEERNRKAEETARAQAEQEQQAAVAQVKTDIHEIIAANAERFETITTYGQQAEELVFRTMAAHYEETGKDLPYLDACDKVEAYLDGEVEKLQKTKKWSTRFKPREEPKPAGGAPPAGGTAPAPQVTLGNAGAPPTTPRRGASQEPDYNAAIAALQGAKF